MTDWAGRHNDALVSPQQSENIILALAYGLWTWCQSDGASDGFGAPNVTFPLFQAFSDALNYELGRLDGGTLSSWAYELVKGLGIDPDTGGWL